MNKKISLSFLLMFLNFLVLAKDKYPIKALCIVPIADMTGEAFEKLNPSCDPREEYKKMAISGEKGKLNCPRIHQILFNEQVNIIEEYQHEAKVEILSAFHQTTNDSKMHCTFCMLKENLLPIEQITDLNLVPEPVDFAKITSQNQNNIATLILPFYDPITKNIYSAGTRFIITGKDKINFTVSIYNPNSRSFVEGKINKNFAIESLPKSNKDKIKIFVDLLNLWTNLDSRFAPFVWGGTSFSQFESSDNYSLIPGQNCYQDEILFYKRESKNSVPFSGFDCSGLILRAAQICQIPYFYKNTTTVGKLLKPLSSNEEIENGDLIFFPGGVIVIVDKENGQCIKSSGYSSGFGKVHKLHLSKCFKDINSVEELRQKYFNDSSLEFLNKKNEVISKINNFKILKLESVWSYNI